MSVNASASRLDESLYRLVQQKWIIQFTNPNKANWEKIMAQTEDQYFFATV